MVVKVKQKALPLSKKSKAPTSKKGRARAAAELTSSTALKRYILGDSIEDIAEAIGLTPKEASEALGNALVEAAELRTVLAGGLIDLHSMRYELIIRANMELVRNKDNADTVMKAMRQAEELQGLHRKEGNGGNEGGGDSRVINVQAVVMTDAT